MIQKIINTYRSSGLTGLTDVIRAPILPRRSKNLKLAKEIVYNKYGLEIGGPSNIFQRKGILPVYKDIGLLDNCNFAGSTMWEGNISEGSNFIFDNSKSPGKQYICESTNLTQITDAKYDFILSSHMLEHTANPIKALKEFIRVLKYSGSLLIILPDKERTFDNKRPITTLQHLINDFNLNINENDLTHLPEILRYHNFFRDPLAGSFDKFQERSLKNIENRGIHHHVFNMQLAVDLLKYLNLNVITSEVTKPFHIIIIARKDFND